MRLFILCSESSHDLHLIQSQSSSPHNLVLCDPITYSLISPPTTLPCSFLSCPTDLFAVPQKH